MIEIDHNLIVPVVFKEMLIRADNFRVFLQAPPDPHSKPNDSLHTIGREKGIAEYLFGFLADAVHAARALDQPDNGPGQVEVHDNGAVLEVLAFAQHVRGDEDAQFVFRLYPVPLFIAFGAKPPCKRCRVGRVSGGAGKRVDSCGLEPGFDVTDGVGKLAEDEDLFRGVFLCNQIDQRFELCVLVVVPLARLFQDTQKGRCVALQVFGQRLHEEAWSEPFEAALILF